MSATEKDDKAPDNNHNDKSIIHHPHDRFFKRSLANQPVAIEFVESHAPANIKELVDTSTIKFENASFIEQDLRDKYSDVLLSAQIKGRDGYLYFLLEEQTTPDYFMSLRLMKYLINICDHYLINNKKAKKLPLVYPIIIYCNKKKYTAPLTLWDLFEEKELAKDIWTQDHKVVNVHDIPDEEMREKAWLGVMEFFLKHMDERHSAKVWREAAKLGLLQIVQTERGFNYLVTAMHYCLTGKEIDDIITIKKALQTALNTEQGEELMGSAAQKLYYEGKMEGKLEGKLEGRQEGIEKTAINMLRAGSDITFISTVTGLSMLEIQKLKAKL